MPPYLRGFAPVLPNFIRRTPSAATGIIVEASPPYPAAMSIILSADLHDNSCNTRLRPSEALPRIKLQKKGMRLRLVFTEFIWSTTSAETGTIIVSGKARQCTNRGFASIPTRLCPGLPASRLELSLRLRPPYPVAMSIIICRRIYTTTNPH